MANIMTYDPGSTEAKSPLIAGLTEGLNKISTILDMTIGEITDSPLNNVPISDTDKNRIYQANTGNRLWLDNPAPVFKKNGVEITKEIDGFEIDYVGGSISFDDLHRLEDSDVVTVTCSYIVNGSKTINDINDAIDDAVKSSERYKGAFTSVDVLEAKYPSSKNGDFAIVLSYPTIFIWVDTTWVDIRLIGDYYTQEETNYLLAEKENKIDKQGNDSASNGYYYSGSKTWQNLAQKVQEIITESGLGGGNVSIRDGAEIIVPEDWGDGPWQIEVTEEDGGDTPGGDGTGGQNVSGYVGEIVYFADSILRPNHVWGDGEAIDPETWPELAEYAAIAGWEQGESGQYHTPDLRGRFLLGASERYAVGTTGGEETHTLTVDELPNIHGGIANIASQSDNQEITSDGVFTKNISGRYGGYGTGKSNWNDEFLLDFGNDSPHNNMPPFFTATPQIRARVDVIYAKAVIACPYEVGDILQTKSAVLPSERWPGTEWEELTGRFLLGRTPPTIGEADEETDPGRPVGTTGGEETHTLSVDELPNIHGGIANIASQSDNQEITSDGVFTKNISGRYGGYGTEKSNWNDEFLLDFGNDSPHNNMPPYQVVYMWERIA